MSRELGWEGLGGGKSVVGFFDSIPQDKLMAAVGEHVADGAVLELIQRFLKQGVLESGKGWSPTDKGTHQGGVLSPLLANIYLSPLDHRMAGKGWIMIRYADDCAPRVQNKLMNWFCA